LPHPFAINGVDIVIDREMRTHPLHKGLAERGKVKSEMGSPERQEGRYGIEVNLQ